MKKPKSTRIKERNIDIYETLKDMPIGSERAIEVQKFVQKYDITIARVYQILKDEKHCAIMNRYFKL
jgi:Mor family transcriptional regulator